MAEVQRRKPKTKPAKKPRESPDGKTAKKDVKYKFKGWWGKWVAFFIFLGVTNLVMLALFVLIRMATCAITHDYRINYCWEELKRNVESY